MNAARKSEPGMPQRSGRCTERSSPSSAPTTSRSPPTGRANPSTSPWDCEADVTDQLATQRAGQSIALPGSDLFEEVRRKLVDDLGMVQVDRRGRERIYRPRAEL